MIEETSIEDVEKHFIVFCSFMSHFLYPKKRAPNLFQLSIRFQIAYTCCTMEAH